MAKPLPAPASNMASNSRSLTPALPQASGCAARSACRAPTRRCAAPATATPAPAGRPARSRSALSVSAVVSPPVVVRPSPPPEPRVETHDYSMAGPYSPSVLLQRIQLKTMDGKNSFNVNMRITYPADAAPGAAFPLVAFFNGFELRAPWYSDTAERVASWGYVVMQYTNVEPAEDGPVASLVSPIVADNFELAFISPLFEHLKTIKLVSSIIDFSRVATMGHSRGGRLATLHFAGRPDVFSTALLIDPVDGVFNIVRQSTVELLKFGGFLLWATYQFKTTVDPIRTAISRALPDILLQVLIRTFKQPAPLVVPEAELPPTVLFLNAEEVAKPAPKSAIDVLNSAKPIAMIGAGVSCVCNPSSLGTYRSFYKKAASSSWLMVLQQAGHMQFWNDDDGPSLANAVINVGSNVLCGAGFTSRTAVISETDLLAVGWLQKSFRLHPDPEAPAKEDPTVAAGLELLRMQLEEKQRRGVLTFEGKK